MKETLVPMVSIPLDELDLFRWNFFTSSPWRDWNGGWSGGRCWRGTQLLQFCRLHRATLGVGWGWRNDLRARESAFFKEIYCEQKHIPKWILGLKWRESMEVELYIKHISVRGPTLRWFRVIDCSKGNILGTPFWIMEYLSLSRWRCCTLIGLNCCPIIWLHFKKVGIWQGMNVYLWNVFFDYSCLLYVNFHYIGELCYVVWIYRFWLSFLVSTSTYSTAKAAKGHPCRDNVFLWQHVWFGSLFSPTCSFKSQKTFEQFFLLPLAGF